MNASTMSRWSPWHGCHRLSPGCKNCYVYRRDDAVGRDASEVKKTAMFDLPLKKKRDKSYRIPDGAEVFTCGTSDFFIEEADEWRAEAWQMIRQRSEVSFFIITKRIHRFEACLPSDWGQGYPNVTIGCTCENQDRADYRLPIFLSLPIAHRVVICEPLLEAVDLSAYLGPGVEQVVAGGESGYDARVCDYRWILSLRDQCREAGVGFWFKQTGARLRKDGRLYRIPRELQHPQARRAGINIKRPAPPAGGQSGAN